MRSQPITSPGGQMVAPRTTTSVNVGSRQHHGGACERCRVKKLKCNGGRPRCSTCVSSNADCEPGPSQARRGPKKGYLRTLQNQIVDLEQKLAQAQFAATPMSVAQSHSAAQYDPIPVGSEIPEISGDFNESFLDLLPETTEPLSADLLSYPVWPNLAPTPDFMTAHLTPSLGKNAAYSFDTVDLGNAEDPSPSTVLGGSSDQRRYPSVSIQADLDLIYFERIHPSVPILHKQQYFHWARADVKTSSQECLQHAMWTSAASVSPSLNNLQTSLYRQTQKLLDSGGNSPRGVDTSIEYVQAQLLIAIHDFVYRSHSQGWITAGHGFRMVQAMGLHRLDDPLEARRSDSDSSGDSWIRLEAQRRVFWMAYCLDVLVSKRGQWPLTLHEHVRATRLPMEDERFQSNKPHEMPFLHEFLEVTVARQLPPNSFLDLVSLCTVSRQIASLKRNRLDTRDRTIVPTRDLYNHHDRLTKMLDGRIEALQANSPSSISSSDPISLFNSMFSQALMLCLCSSVERSTPPSVNGYRGIIVDWEQRASGAVFCITGLTRSIVALSYFKMHPFTPLPLAICRDFLESNARWIHESTESEMDDLSHLLRDMGSINSVAQEYLLECEQKLV